jgi:UDP-galactopyranose mutase
VKDPDVAIVGGGLFGLVVAACLTRALPGISVLIVEAANRLGGLCRSQWNEHLGVHVHPYGTHVLATDDPKVWAFTQAHTRVQRHRQRVYASYRGSLVPLPLGMEAVEAVFADGGTLTRDRARRLVERDRGPFRNPRPETVEEAALSEVGPRLYEAFVRGHITKQWGDPSRLDPRVFTSRFGITYGRRPYRYRARYQGLPAGGWGSMLDRMAERPGVRVELGRQARADEPPPYRYALVVTSPLDQWFGSDLGTLGRGSLAIDWRAVPADRAPEHATVTYPDTSVPYYRTHTPALLPFGSPTLPGRRSLVGFERSGTGDCQVEFVLRTPENTELAAAYRRRAHALAARNQFFGGRGSTFHQDMGTTIADAMACADRVANLLRTPATP